MGDRRARLGCRPRQIQDRHGALGEGARTPEEVPRGQARMDRGIRRNG